MVSVKCSCQHITTKKRVPSRCEACGARLAMVGGVLVEGPQGSPAPAAKVINAKKAPAALDLGKGKPKEPAKPQEEKPKEPPKEPPKAELFDCGTCGEKEVVKRGDPNCPKCGATLDWDQVG